MAPQSCLVPVLLAAVVSGPVYVVAESCTAGGSGKGLALVQRTRLLRTKYATEHEELEEHDRAGLPLRGMHRSHGEGDHDDMSDLLQSLVATAVREGRNLTSVERQAFDDMKAVLENTTVAKLQDAATADQQSLHDIAQAMEDCGLNLTSQNTTLQLQKSLAVAAYDAYMEASLAANSTAVVLAEKELAMSTFMAESPQPTVATNQSHSAELVIEVRRLMEWAADYLQHADALEAASNESDTLLANRTAQQQLWEEAYCAWLAQKELMLTSYNLCWQASAQSYNSTLIGVQANTEARRLALSAILKLTCLVDVISSPTQEQEAKLNVCETQDYNTSDIDVAEPVLPEKTDLSAETQFHLEADFDCAPPTTTSAATVATTTTTAAATTTTTSTTTVSPHIVFSDTNGGRLIRCWAPFDGTDGSCEELISTDQFEGTWGFTQAADGDFVVVDGPDHTVKKCSPGGSCNVVVGESGVASQTPTTLNWPKAVAIDGSHYVVVERGNHRCQRCPMSGGSCETILEGLNNPTDVSLAPDGNYFITEHNGMQVKNCTPVVGSECTTLIGKGVRNDLYFPGGLSIASDGHYIVADMHHVFDCDPNASGPCTQVVGGQGSSNTQLNEPWKAIKTPEGEYIVADNRNNRIQKCPPTPGQACTTVAGQGKGGMNIGMPRLGLMYFPR